MAAAGRVVILVPWRTDDGPRARVWDLCRRRWEALFPDWPIYEGRSPDGPFSRSAAINDAAAQADDWDIALIIDADVLLSRKNVRAAVDRARKTGRVTWAHRRWRGISQEATDRLINRPSCDAIGGITSPEFAGADLDLIVERTTRISWSCCIAIRRDAWDRIGGFDERFAGWGHEDAAFAASTALVGWDRIEGDVLNLWHPRTPGAGKADRDHANRYTAQALVNGRLGMRYMVALRRDYGLTDRVDRPTPDVLARDIANLERQDEDFAKRQTAAERKPWDAWWPTLEELRDGAKAHRAALDDPKVTLIVHTGGSPEAWPERREYLARSLASLTERVSGPIVQRVVYSDWGEHRDELEALVAPFGFYVAGVGHHGYTESMQRMWQYLNRRGLGEFVFQTEDDFAYDQPVDLAAMIDTLRAHPHLRQLALLRAPYYPRELAAGSIIAEHPADYTFVSANGHSRIEHRLYFTANPSLFRRSLTTIPWPSGKSSERLYTDILNREPRSRFAYLGDGTPQVRHIGAVRAGEGY